MRAAPARHDVGRRRRRRATPGRRAGSLARRVAAVSGRTPFRRDDVPLGRRESRDLVTDRLSEPLCFGQGHRRIAHAHAMTRATAIYLSTWRGAAARRAGDAAARRLLLDASLNAARQT